MSLRRVIPIAASIAAVCGLLAWAATAHRRVNREAAWNDQAIKATFEMVVPAHNDASFRYVLENRTDSDYRIAKESEIQIVGKSRRTGEWMTKTTGHISGEIPLWAPAHRKVHFALVWTAAQDIDPDRLDAFVRDLDVGSFVLFDRVRGYRIEFPVGR